MRRFSIYAAFVLSGAAGLVYEVVWTRYLGLFLGHSAYAQILVLTVYLGGMAAGSLAIGEGSKRLRSPLLWYAGAELLLAVAGLLFHFAFSIVTDVSYETIFPALSSASWVGAARWGLAGMLILPQAVVLGTTFPLMAAGLVREDWAKPGRSVASVYLANSLGGAAGVLLAGFWLVATYGLLGTLIGAAILNAAAAALAWKVTRVPTPDAGPEERLPGEAGSPESVAPPPGPWASDTTLLWRVLLTVSFGTAVASFAYEIGWIRMLSLVLGSATHAFELMLSAFILGLAIGAWLIREWTDRAPDPLRLLGGIQVLMGLAALATLPLYLASFEIMESLVAELPGRAGGYATFNLSRYALCLAVMLPSTVMAGMTLPVIVGSLLRAGAGERAIGRVYGINTLGSVVGASLAGLVAMPILGLRGLLMAGAGLDIALGIGLLVMSARSHRKRPTLAAWTTMVAATCVALVAWGVHLDQSILSSGVFRGNTRRGDDWDLVYYQDGRTATVSAQVRKEDGFVVLSTNGKPDASLGARWYVDRRDTVRVTPIEEQTDFTTQVLAPLVALAYAPSARNVANIGHGSGMSGTSLLAGSEIRRLVTIEIEPFMVEGSFVFLPSNKPVFADPRSTFAFDDAKSFFSARRERFDIIFAEPSNPWVSGVSGLFTLEFYERIGDYLTEDGVLGQWIQLYDLDDDLFLSILAALDSVFPSYRGYLVGRADLAIVASMGPSLPEPDWSVLDLAGIRRMTLGAPPFTPDQVETLQLFDESTFRSLLAPGIRPNSDYHPILDLGAERASFLGVSADGLLSFASSQVDLRKNLTEEGVGPLPYRLPPARGLMPMVKTGRAAWFRQTVATDSGVVNVHFPDWTTSLLQLRSLLAKTRTDEPPESWLRFAADFGRAERESHWGTVGWADEEFYTSVYGYLARTDAPPEAHAAVDLMYGTGTWDWTLAASAADLLLGAVDGGEQWVPPTVLLDAAVIAYLKTGQPQAARNALSVLTSHTDRSNSNLRNRLLEALIDEALVIPVTG